MDGRSKAPVKFMYQPQEGLLVHYDVPVHSRGGGTGSGSGVCCVWLVALA